MMKKMLLEQDAERNLPIHIAIENGYSDIAKLYIDKAKELSKINS